MVRMASNNALDELFDELKWLLIINLLQKSSAKREFKKFFLKSNLPFKSLEREKLLINDQK